jgi:ASC-1-like (ASCH) protein
LATTLWIKEQYLQQILRGEKTVEVRVGYPNILRLKAGDAIRLNDRHAATIRRVARYHSFDELLEAEDRRAIAPRLSEEELLSALRSIYPTEKEALGAVALELELAPTTG